MLDLGVGIGAVGFSGTVKEQDQESGLIHTYSDVGNYGRKFAAGTNLYGWLGAAIGANTEGNIFTSTQITPWMHYEFSVGVDGVSQTIGFDYKNQSYDFERKCGWGFAFVLVVAPQLIPIVAGSAIAQKT